MTALKVIQIGNSDGVVLPKEAMAELNAKRGDLLYLTKAPDGSMRISAYSEDVARQVRAAQEAMRRYRHTLRALAQ